MRWWRLTAALVVVVFGLPETADAEQKTILVGHIQAKL